MESRDSPIPERVAGAREGRQSAATALALIVGLVAVALVKPWGAVGTAGPEEPADVFPRPTAGRADLVTAATPDPARLAADRLAEVCLEPAGWRVVATERWGDQAIRTWRAAVAATASGPLDPAIEFTPVAGEAVPLLGYCAPVSGEDRPPDDARGSVLALSATTVRPISAVRFAPPDDLSGGAVWLGRASGSSGGAFSLTWPVGRYVIRLGTADGRYERWLGVEILRPLLERG